MRGDRDLRYFTDTEGGSSGSPVLNDEWKVVALHRGSAFAKGVDYQGRSTAYINLGTQIHAILAHIQANAPDLARELGVNWSKRIKAAYEITYQPSSPDTSASVHNTDFGGDYALVSKARHGTFSQVKPPGFWSSPDL